MEVRLTFFQSKPVQDKLMSPDLPSLPVKAGKTGGDYARTRRRDKAPVPVTPEAGASFLFGGDPANCLIAPEWPKIAIVMLLTAILPGFFNLALPPLLPTLLGLMAAGGAYLSSRALRYERANSLETGKRMALMGLSVAMPMFLFGSAIGFFGESGAISWFACIAIVATMSLLATVIQSGRLIGVLAAQVAVWAGITCVTSQVGGYLTLLLGVVIALAAYLRQRRIDLLVREKAQIDQRAQTRAQEILSDYEETGQGWFWETDRRGQLTYLSRPVAEIIGRQVEELIGRPFSELFNLSEQAGEGERTLAFHLSARSSFGELAVRAAASDEERWWSITGRPTYDTFNNFTGFRGSGTDLTEKRRSQEHASRLAHFDSLTGLSNRFRMSQTLEKILLAPQVHHRACALRHWRQPCNVQAAAAVASPTCQCVHVQVL